MSAGVNRSKPTTAEFVGGVSNAMPPTLQDGLGAGLQLDVSGNVKNSGEGGSEQAGGDSHCWGLCATGSRHGPVRQSGNEQSPNDALHNKKNEAGGGVRLPHCTLVVLRSRVSTRTGCFSELAWPELLL